MYCTVYTGSPLPNIVGSAPKNPLQVTTSFYAAEKGLWNMLTRTSIHPVFMSHRLNMILFISLVWRWGWLLPMR